MNLRYVRLCLAVCAGALLLSSCASYPTLVQVARQRNKVKKNDLTGAYQIADVDVLNYTDQVKGRLAQKFDTASLTRYGSNGAQVTLSSLAGAAQIAGWGVGAASGLGSGATYLFGLGNIIDTKGHAAAYEQAFTNIQAAEASYYFRQVGMTFEVVNGQNRVVVPKSPGRTQIPATDRLTPDGETLYYRVSKTIRVLDDVLASKIPDLQDLKEAKGENSGKSPLISSDSAKAGKPSAGE